MYCIRYRHEDQVFADIRQRLIGMSMAYSMEQDATVVDIVLVSGVQCWEGKLAIHEHLDQAQSELSLWHYCNY